MNPFFSLVGKVIIDCVLVVCGVLAVIYFEYHADPFQRGFFCEDDDLKYPLKVAKTFPLWSLWLIIFVPLAVMLFTEATIYKCSLKKIIFEIYKRFGVYIFGFLLHWLLLDFIKCSVGRLRPNFFEWCKPVLEDGSDCRNTTNHGVYITDYFCSNSKASKSGLREVHLSFPSAHTSMTFFAMTYLVLYIHDRWKLSKTVKFAVEFSCILLAVSVAVSRISYYWHFPTDVIAGFILGTVSAFLVKRFASHSPKEEILLLRNDDIKTKCEV